MELRSYQTEALNKIRGAYGSGCSRQLVVAATGVGKGLILANIRNWLNLKGKMFVFVHREEIVMQLAEHLEKWNPGARVGIEMAEMSACHEDDDIVVASVQTVGRKGSSRLGRFNPKEFCLLVADEVHHGTSQTYMNVFDYFNVGKKKNSNILSVGFTATPNRSDGQGLGGLYDEIVFQYPIHRAIAEGWLVPIKSYAIRTRSSLDSVAYRAGDFAIDELSEVINTDQRNNIVVNGWKQHAYGKQTICFASNIAHAIALAKTFRNAGVRSEAIWGNDPNRGFKLERYRSKETQVLVNINIFTEGFDDPTTSCILMARPTTSNLLFTQAIGRGLRLQEGTGNLVEMQARGNLLEKMDCTILDVTDNCEKHKLMTTATLFGLPPRFDIKGKSATEAGNKFNEIQKKHPSVDFNGLTSFEELDTYLRTVDLFDTRGAKELEKISKLTWHKFNEIYCLAPTCGLTCQIKENLLGKFELHLENEKPEEFHSIDDAVAYAESYAKQTLNWLDYKFLQRRNKIYDNMAKKPASDSQKNLIRRMAGDVLGIDELDMKKASNIITKLFAEKSCRSPKKKKS